MTERIVEVVAPSRLHFGLFSFGRVNERQFGGIGAMIRRPSLRLRISDAAELRASGPLAKRAVVFARRWAEYHSLPSEPQCCIEIRKAPPAHSGLGVGTQLGLAIAEGLSAFLKRRRPTPALRAQSVGRGLRSAVGTYGFAFGGLIVEAGKLPHEKIAPLECRLPIPANWRFVTMRPAGEGLSGAVEENAFSRLPPVPTDITESLIKAVRERILPAVAEVRFDDFSEALYEFGRQAGMCFADAQGGPFNGPLLENIVKTVRAMGVRGVGQSSWGPTLFAVLPSEDSARQFVHQIKRRFVDAIERICISPPDNHGARIRVRDTATIAA